MNSLGNPLFPRAVSRIGEAYAAPPAGSNDVDGLHRAQYSVFASEGGIACRRRPISS